MDEERKSKHTHKDFQVATQELLIYNSALLLTIIQQQTVIISTLTKEDFNEGWDTTCKLVQQNRKAMELYFDVVLPNFPDVRPPLKNSL